VLLALDVSVRSIGLQLPRYAILNGLVNPRSEVVGAVGRGGKNLGRGPLDSAKRADRRSHVGGHVGSPIKDQKNLLTPVPKPVHWPT
jgi:hypothetical protein